MFGWEILGTGTIGGGAHKPYFLLNLSTDPLSTGFEDRARVSTAIDEFDPLTIAMKCVAARSRAVFHAHLWLRVVPMSVF